MDVGQVFESYLWQKRVVLVFSPDQNNRSYSNQMRVFDAVQAGMLERDIAQWVIIENTLVTKEGGILPHVGTPKLYRHFDVSTQKFTVILLGKDGEEKLRSHDVVSPEKLFALIDSMPMRKQEMRDN